MRFIGVLLLAGGVGLWTLLEYWGGFAGLSTEYRLCMRHPSSACMAKLGEEAFPKKWDARSTVAVPKNLLAAGRPALALGCSKECEEPERMISTMHLKIDEIMKRALDGRGNDCRNAGDCLLAAELLSVDHQDAGGGDSTLLEAEEAAYARHGKPWNTRSVSALLDQSLEAIEQAPPDKRPRLLAWHSQLLTRVGRAEEGRAGFSKLVEMPGGISQVQMSILMRIGAIDQALQVTEGQAREGEVESQLGIARELIALGNTDRAVQVVSHAIEGIRGHWTTNLRVASLLREAARIFAEANRADLARTPAELAYQMATTSTASKFYASRYFIDAAWSFLHAGDRKQSLEMLQRAIDVFPADDDAAPPGSLMWLGRFRNSPFKPDLFADVTGALCRLGDPAAAASFGQKFRHSKVVFAFYTCRADLGDTNATPEAAARALHTSPDGLLYYLSAVRFIELGDDAAAATAIQSAAAGDSATDRYTNDALMRLAVALRREDVVKELMRRTLMDVRFSSRATMSNRLSKSAALTVRYPGSDSVGI